MTYTVRLTTGESFTAQEYECVLAAAAHAGVGLPCDCRLGGCGTCRVVLVAGTVTYDEEPAALSPDEIAAGYALACQARPTSDLEIRVASAALAPPARRAARVSGMRRLADDVVHLQLRVDGDDPVEFMPGQYMKLRLGGGAARNFSMASKPCGRDLDFHIRRIAGGHFTDGLLRRLAPGDPLDVELPHGAFFYREADARPIVMAATGTGLAPIKSMLESVLEAPDRPPVTLYWGARTRADLYLHEALALWAAQYRNLRYEPVLSRGDATWKGRRGHVQDAACEDFPDLSGHAIYLCGSPVMIAGARKAFVERGGDSAFIYADSFTFQRAAATGALAENPG